jgi:hypothetical protein
MTLKYSNFFFLQKLHPTSPVSTPFPNYPIFKSIPKSYPRRQSRTSSTYPAGP